MVITTIMNKSKIYSMNNSDMVSNNIICNSKSNNNSNYNYNFKKKLKKYIKILYNNELLYL